MLQFLSEITEENIEASVSDGEAEVAAPVEPAAEAPEDVKKEA
jgi:hypothetical protein